MARRVAWVLVMIAAGALQAAAQNVETDPLQCWWRTSAGAIRAGETFSAVLTCAVIETPDVKVVVDESRLEPSVAQFPPFEVTGGSHAADLRNGDRRFFQYEYRLRLIAENMFGKDVSLPETKLTYRIQSRIGQKAGTAEAIAGRDQTYLLPPLAMRLLSLVPADASDIRDSGHETFADVDRRSFRANVFTVVGGVLFTLAALIAVLTIVRLLLRARKPSTAAERLVSDSTILRGVGRELNAIRRARDDNGWTPELATRALAALRIVGTYALGRPAARAVLPPLRDGAPAPTAAQTDGRMVINVGWPKSRKVAVSGAATPRSVADAIAHYARGSQPGELESVEEALSRFTVAQYGRPMNGNASATVDDAALDESMQTGQQILGRLKVEQLWVMKRLRPNRRLVAIESRVWSH